MAMDRYQADPITGPRCSTLSGELGEPLAGSGSSAATWLCVEQPGPWGREVWQSHLDADLGRKLVARTEGTGVRMVLIRRPGSHPDRDRPRSRQIYLAHTVPGRTWLERGSVADPKELLDLDFTAAGEGTPSGLGTLVSPLLLLVCTNSRRDICCALAGRPIAAALAATHDERVWECTHLGGHRFAPTAVTLPTGYSYGRLDLAAAARLLDPDTGVLLEHCRGRSTWLSPGQVAEVAVRTTTGDRDPDTVLVTEVEPAGTGRWRVQLSHVDGRKWVAFVVERSSPALFSTSCAADPKPVTFLELEALTP